MLKITVTLDQQLYQGDALLQEAQAHVACLLPLGRELTVTLPCSEAQHLPGSRC